MADSEWIASLTAGADVIVCQPSYGGMTRVVRPVVRLTATRVIVGTKRFRRATGHEISSGWHGAWLQEATPERVASVCAEERRRANYELVRQQSWKAVDDATLEAIAELLRAIRAPNAAPTPPTPER